MPGSNTHRHITSAALRAAGIEAPELERSYCLYPDDYYSDPEKIAPYVPMLNGIPFHYFPDTPVNDLYRYWRVDGSRKVVQSRPFRNDNYRHAVSGFRFCYRKIRSALRQGKRTEAEKFLGVLLHVLEDSSFGIHALEGAGGVDVYALDRLSGKPVLRALTKFNDEGLDAAPYTPKLLGATPELASMRLYAEYVRASTDSRHAMFQLALSEIAGVPADARAQCRRMFNNAVRLAADAAYTAFHMAEADAPQPLALDALEPIRFPLGGADKWRLRGAEIMPGLIAFGVNDEVFMHYDVAPGYRTLTGRLRWREPAPGTQLRAAFLNNGRAVWESDLTPEHPEAEITVETPRGICGVTLASKAPSGTFEMADFLLK